MRETVRVPAGVVQPGDTLRYYMPGPTDLTVLRVLPPAREGEAGRWVVSTAMGRQAVPFGPETLVLLLLRNPSQNT